MVPAMIYLLRHADRGGAGHVAVPDHLRRRRRHRAAGGRERHGRCRAGADAAGRRRDRRAARQPLRRASCAASSCARCSRSSCWRWRRSWRRSHGAARPPLSRSRRSSHEARWRCSSCALLLGRGAAGARRQPCRPISRAISSPSPPASPAPRSCCSARPTAPGDVIAVVRGPERDRWCGARASVAGIWINARRTSPSRTCRATTRLSATARSTRSRRRRSQALHQIGLDNLRFEPPEPRVPARRAHDLPRRADRRAEARAVSSPKIAGRVAFLGDRLFRATLDFPAERADRNLSRRGVAGPRRHGGGGADDAAA